MSERGQSEVIGFVLVFSLIVTAVAVVSVAAYPGLEDARTHAKVTNAERGFEVLADNVDDLVRDEASSRATELEVADGTLTTRGTTRINVSANGTSKEYTLRPIVYAAPQTDTQIVYVNGAVIRADAEGVTMVREPRATFGENHIVVPIVRTNVVGDRSVGGTTTVLAETKRTGATLGPVDADGGDLTIRVTSPRADAWGRYFQENGCTLDDQGVNYVDVTCSADRVHVPVVDVDVRFE